MHPTTLLAYEMNGEPLPILHGAPLRLIVPGWAGDSCVKWLTHITVQENEAEGFYMQTAYRMPMIPVQPGAAIPSSQMTPVTEMPVKSIIARPLEGAKVRVGTLQVEGVAFTGEGEIVHVEVSLDEASNGMTQTWARNGRCMHGDSGGTSGKARRRAVTEYSPVRRTVGGRHNR